MRCFSLSIVIALSLTASDALAAETAPKARLCIKREEQNGSLNISPTILSLRSQATGKPVARKGFDDAGSLCVTLPQGRYILSVRLAKPWTRGLPLHWWTRRYPIDLRSGEADYVMTNPTTNDQFQAMIAGSNGWHRLWPVHRVR